MVEFGAIRKETLNEKPLILDGAVLFGDQYGKKAVSGKEKADNGADAMAGSICQRYTRFLSLD